MSGIRLKYVHQWVDTRHGNAKPRYYFRRPGFARVPLPGMPGSAEFMQAYQHALAGQALPRPMIGASRTKPDSISALTVSYYSSTSFLELAPGTQQTYRLILEKFRAAHGDKPAALLTREHIKAMLAQKMQTRAAANHWLRLVKALMAFAVEEGWRKDDPTAGVKRIKNKTDGFHTWTPRTKSRSSRRTIPSVARHASRSHCCSTPRSAARMSCAWVGSTSAMALCMCANRRPERCSPSRCTLPSPTSSMRHRAST
jgi:hypothetical protein